jgi:hypothetical protein
MHLIGLDPMIIYNGGIMNKLKLSQENKKKKKKHMCIS